MTLGQTAKVGVHIAWLQTEVLEHPVIPRKHPDGLGMSYSALELLQKVAISLVLHHQCRRHRQRFCFWSPFLLGASFMKGTEFEGVALEARLGCSRRENLVCGGSVLCSV